MSDRGHVVIVDDDTSSAAALQELLEKDGYVVESTGSGSHALEAIVSARANLVLVDTHLSLTNPFELLEELKASQQARDIPVIFMTSLDDAEAKVKGLESGDDLIVKPFDAREVLARIERQVTVSKVRELDAPGIEPFVGGSVYYGAATSEAVHYQDKKGVSSSSEPYPTPTSWKASSGAWPQPSAKAPSPSASSTNTSKPSNWGTQSQFAARKV